MSGRARTVTDRVPYSVVEESAKRIDFDEAFVLHHRAVYRTAYVLVRNVAQAEDVTQEVFLRLYRHLDSVASEEMLRAWLLRVAINVARNELRGQHRTLARDGEFAKTVLYDEESTPGPDAEYERRAEIVEAQRALGGVREPARSCLLLQQQGLSYREIADALEINEASVGSLLARGRKEFVRMFGKVRR